MQVNALSEILLVVGGILLLVSVIFRMFPPKGINALYGYRTPRSMNSEEAWNYSQSLASRYMLILSLSLIVLAFISMLFDISSWSPMLQLVLSLAVIIFGFMMLIYLVELALRRNFKD